MKMKAKLLLLLSVVTLFSCGSDDKSDNVDYAWVNVSLSVSENNQKSEERLLKVQTLKSESDVMNLAARDGMSATGIAFFENDPTKDFAIVSYHSNEGTYKGALELVAYDANGFTRVYGGLDFNDARVNNVTTDGKDRAFISLDTRKGPVLAVVKVSSSGILKETLNAIYLSGESANGLLFSSENGIDYIYSATGGDGVAMDNSLAEDKEIVFDNKTIITKSQILKRPGFQKTKVDGMNLTPMFMQGNANNRGKWIAKDGKDFVTLHYSTYGQYSHATVQYYSDYVGSFFARLDKRALIERMSIIKGKNTISIRPGENESVKMLYICAGDKGFQSVKIDLEAAKGLEGITDAAELEKAKENVFIKVDNFDKLTYAAVVTDNNAYLACGELGVKVLSVNNGKFTPQKYFKNNKFSSANFIVERGNVLYVAYGKEGVLSIPKESTSFKLGSGDF